MCVLAEEVVRRCHTVTPDPPQVTALLNHASSHGIVTARGGKTMRRFFTLEYWTDDGWYVGRLKEVPGVFSQGETLDELKENIADAYHMVISSDGEPPREGALTLEVGVEV